MACTQNILPSIELDVSTQVSFAKRTGRHWFTMCCMFCLSCARLIALCSLLIVCWDWTNAPSKLEGLDVAPSDVEMPPSGLEGLVRGRLGARCVAVVWIGRMWALRLVGALTKPARICHLDSQSFSFTVWKMGSNLTWNCGLTSPVSRLKTRATLRECKGLCPK